MAYIQITPTIQLPESEFEFSAIRAQGAGGQNVNKVSSAVHLRFHIPSSSLPQEVKDRLLKASDRRITADGWFIIKAQQYRSLEKNREDALARFRLVIQRATLTRKKRKPSRPSKAARAKRVDSKTRRGKVKALRKKVSGQ